MTKKKKEKEFRFFWEEPLGAAEKGTRNMRKSMQGFFGQPFEVRFTVPRFTMPQIRTPVNMGQTDKEIVVRAELPGFKKNEINLNVSDDRMEIFASKKLEKKESGRSFYRWEASSNTVRRAFTLPQKVDPDKAEARLEDGVLTVILPKMYPISKKKKLQIK